VYTQSSAHTAEITQGLETKKKKLIKKIDGYSAPTVLEYVKQKSDAQRLAKDIKPWATRVQTAEVG
jgi:hypothetical protein